MTLPIAELHVHLEGTLSPALVRRLAARHNMKIADDLFSAQDEYVWSDFAQFLTAFDKASAVIKTPEDYADVTYDYLAQCAKEGAIYVEMMASPDHAQLMGGMSYADMLDGIVAGIDRALKDFGIVGRIISTGVRHFGVEKVEAVARATVKHSHPYVVGFGLGGDEANFPPRLFERAYAIAREAGLGLTVHVGEWTGPDSIREAVKYLNVTRLGHGVRAVEDAHLMAELREKNIALEVCPTSNIALGVYADYARHPFPALYHAGLRVTLNSDDPPFFHATVGGEYRIARAQFGFSEDMLRSVTRNAVAASFADDGLKARLMAKI